MKIDILGLIPICFGFVFLIIIPYSNRYAKELYSALGWKVNMKILKVFYVVNSILFILFGVFQFVGLLQIK